MRTAAECFDETTDRPIDIMHANERVLLGLQSLREHGACSLRPLGELTALPRTHYWTIFPGKGEGKEKGKGKKEKENGKKRRERREVRGNISSSFITPKGSSEGKREIKNTGGEREERMEGKGAEKGGSSEGTDVDCGFGR